MDIKYAVLKGDTLSKYYKYPAMRLSGDIDILIDEKDEVKVLEFMSKNGFTYEARNEGNNHTVCFHPVYGVVEVHISLYCNFMDDLWFKNTNELEEYTYVDLPDRKEPTLSITDGYIYTVFHTIKHFLSNGLSVKQMMDIVLYTKENFNEINFKKAFGVFEENQFLRMVYCIYYISNHYFNIKIFDDFDNFDVVSEKLLTECENSGAFGKKSDLKDFFEVYTKMKIDKSKQNDFQSYMTSWRRKSLKGYLSMSEMNMKLKYPNLKTGKARIVHLKNILKKGFKYSYKIKQFVKYKPQSISGEMENRIEIIKELNMI
jgi:hypothetical protein